MSPEIDFYCILKNTELLKREGFDSPNVIPVEIRNSGRLQRYAFAVNSMVRAHKLNMLHCQFAAPAFVSCKILVTIHDILAETHPEFFSPCYRLLAGMLQRHAVRRSHHLFTVSQYSRKQISRVYNVDEENISVLLNGVDTTRFVPLHASGQSEVEEFGLQTGNYILIVGRLEPRKNHERLLRAYASLPHGRPPLVIVGQKDSGFEQGIGNAVEHSIHRVMRELKLDESVRLLSNVGAQELPKLYRNARIFVYPSLAEGFGMPILEAMASGIPVITSNNTALQEAAGNAAMLVDPSSIESIQSALAKLLYDDSTREMLIKRGFKNIQRFNWCATARVLRDSYHRLLAISSDTHNC